MQPLDIYEKPSCFPHSLAILLIPFLFLSGVVGAYLGYFSLAVEPHTLGIVAFIFVVFAFFVQHNANYSVCHIRGTFRSMDEALKEALEENALTIMGKTKSTLHIEEFMKTYYKDVRNDNFAKVAPSVFPMLGILGTFVAIAISMPDFTSKDVGGLDNDISMLLSGIGTAFYASIYGIMLSLVWTYFENRGLSKIGRQIYDLERVYGKQIWTQAELIKHQHMQSELKDQEIVQTLKETFNLDFVKELNEQYLVNFTSIINDTTHSFTSITQSMQLASNSLRRTIEDIEAKKSNVSAVEKLEANIENFTKSATTLQNTLEKFDGSVEHTFVKIDEELGNAVTKLASFTEVLSEQNSQILNNLSKFTPKD